MVFKWSINRETTKVSQNWLITNLKPPEVSQKRTINCHFTQTNRPSSVIVFRHVWKLQTAALLNLQTRLCLPDKVKIRMLEEKVGKNCWKWRCLKVALSQKLWQKALFCRLPNYRSKSSKKDVVSSFKRWLVQTLFSQ